MSRDASGTYTAPSSSFNPAVEGTTIDEGDWNSLLADLTAALTESAFTAGMGSTDNALIRADGTSGKKTQGSAVVVDDSGNMSGVAAIAATTIELGHASDTTIARTGAGDISVEGNALYRAGGNDVPIADGGTGQSTAAAAFSALGDGLSTTQGAIAYRNASAWVALAPGLSGQVLQSGGAGANLNWSAAGSGDVTGPASSVDSEIALFSGTAGKTIKRATTTGLLKGTSGVLSAATAGTDYYNPGGTDVAITDGGTGQSTASAGFSALADGLSTTQGAIAYRSASAWVALAPGTSGQVLQSGGAGANPSWIAAASGDVTGQASSVDSEIALFSGTGGKTIKRATTTGLLKSTSGVLSAATAGTDYYNPGGTDVAIADGGTGQSTASAGFSALADGLSSTQGAIAYRGASAWVALAPGLLGQVLQSGGAGANPSWTAVAGTGDVTAASTFGTDNVLIRSDGTGKGVQSSGISVDDSNNVTGARSIALPTIPNVGFATLVNVGLSATVATNAMTIALKGADGNNPSSTNPVYIPAPNFSTTTGAPVWRSVTGALSVVIPSGTTIGTANATQSPIYVYALDNSGTIELAVSLKYHGEAGTVTTTAISGGATSTTMYSTTARTSKGYRILGVVYSTQTTAGTWAASPSATQVAPLKLKDYGFRADRSSNQTGWLTATQTKVQLNSESFDNDSTFDSSTNYRFTCEEPGIYFFNGSGDSNGGVTCTFYVYKNGSINLTLTTKAASTVGVSLGSGPISLVPGDYVELYGYQASGATDAIYGFAGYTWLSGRINR